VSPSRFELVNLAAIRAALDHHNRNCSVEANAILLNPTDHGLLGWDDLWGLPILPDERVPVKRVRIRCDGSAWRIEDELESYLSTGPEEPGESDQPDHGVHRLAE
jgi:hypothetical protein